MLDYRAAAATTASRPPLPSGKWHRFPSTERDDRDRTARASSLQRPANYLPAFDRI